MKVLLNDGLDRDGINLFEQAGIETDSKKRDLGQLVDEIGQFDGLIVRSGTEVTRKVIETGAKGSLKIIGRAGVGYDNVDVDAASENGIVVKFAPSGNTTSAAELALSLMLDVSRKVSQADYTLKNGIWRKKPFSGTELSGKTLGIIGCGRVGQRLAQLTLGFNMPVIGYDSEPDRVRLLFPDSRIRYTSLEEVLSQADYVSLHTGGKSTVIGERELAKMKPEAYLVNTSRGSNVDEEALYRALKEKRIAGAGIDVYSGEDSFKEGGLFNHPFRELDNVVLTSHLGASTKEAQRRTSIEITQVVIEYLVGENIFGNAVNVGETVASEQRPTYKLFITHQDVLGAFARIGDVFAKHGINIRDNPSRQLGSDGYVITRYSVHQQPTPEVLTELRQLGIVKRATL